MKASIDIGTNTALLLVAEIEDGNFKILHEEQQVPRLGEGVDEKKHLSNEAIERVISSLVYFQKIISQEYPSVETIKITATSAVRDAKNRNEFLEIVKNRTGLRVQVLSGYQEALYTFQGAISILSDLAGTPKVVIDIGGGSTEIAVGNREIVDRYSYDMGCVRFTERFLKNDPPTDKQLHECRQAIQQIFKEYEFSFDDNVALVGVAGTVTSLAFIDKDLKTYKSNVLAGYVISTQAISDYIQRFKTWSRERLLTSYPEVMKGRADIFLAGLLILDEFMQKYKFEKLVTSTGGIRHGIILGTK